MEFLLNSVKMPSKKGENDPTTVIPKVMKEGVDRESDALHTEDTGTKDIEQLVDEESDALNANDASIKIECVQR